MPLYYIINPLPSDGAEYASQFLNKVISKKILQAIEMRMF